MTKTPAHGRFGRFAAVAALLVLPACDTVDRARSQLGTTDTVSVASTGSGVMLGLQAPGMLRAGEEGVLRLSVTNRTDTTAIHIRLELIVPAWAEPMPPLPGDREVSMVSLAEGGTRFSYLMQEAPLERGQTQSVEQRIRVPVDGVPGEANAPWNGVVRARLLGAHGEALAEVEGHIGLGAAVVPGTTPAGGTADRRDQVGPVRLGMAGVTLRQAVSAARDTSWEQDGTTQRGTWVPLGSDSRTLAVLSGDTVVRLEVRDAAVRTRERLGVGSRFDELRSSYGTACADVAEGAVVVWFATAPGIRFALDAPVPSNVAQLRQNPDGLPATAKVTRWWLHRGAESCTR
jgi:hypothetical protein